MHNYGQPQDPAAQYQQQHQANIVRPDQNVHEDMRNQNNLPVSSLGKLNENPELLSLNDHGKQNITYPSWTQNKQFTCKEITSDTNSSFISKARNIHAAFCRSKSIDRGSARANNADSLLMLGTEALSRRSRREKRRIKRY